MRQKTQFGTETPAIISITLSYYHNLVKVSIRPEFTHTALQQHLKFLVSMSRCPCSPRESDQAYMKSARSSLPSITCKQKHDTIPIITMKTHFKRLNYPNHVVLERLDSSFSRRQITFLFRYPCIRYRPCPRPSWLLLHLGSSHILPQASLNRV
jgi:hypothetical protein